MNPWLKYLIIIAVLAAVGGLFYNKVYIPKTSFVTVTPTKGSLSVTVRGIGNVSAKNIYTITAQSGGKILEIATDEGQWVKQDQLLIVMDGVDLSAQLEGAKASLEKAKFDIVASQNELKNQLTQKDLLQKTYDRYKKLNKQGYAAQSEYDKAATDLQGIQTMIAVSSSHINAAKAESKRAQKSIEAIQTKIQRLKVYAPVDGYVISKEIEVAQNVLPTTSILRIVDPKTLWVKTNIDERISAQIQLGQKAVIRLRSQPKNPLSGSVKRVNAMSDAVTLEREINISFETIPKPFYINEQAEVTIEVKHYDDVMKIPLHVVVQENGVVGVWIVQEGHAHFEKLEKIAQSDSEIAVSNLDEQTEILVPNAKKKPLSEGMKIHL